MNPIGKTIQNNISSLVHEFGNSRIVENRNEGKYYLLHKLSNVTTLKIMVEYDPKTKLKIFDLLTNKFKPIPDFQMKSSFSNIA